MMKLRKTLPIVAVLPLLAALAAPAQDNGVTFLTRCAPCHGNAGEGKSSVAPKIAGKSTDEVLTVLSKGGQPKSPHNQPMTTLTSKQITAITGYLKTLK